MRSQDSTTERVFLPSSPRTELPKFRTPDIPKRVEDQPVPLSYAQQRLWFLDQLAPGNAFYNIHGSLRLRFAVDADALEKSLNELVARHESLRTVFRMWNGEPVQLICAQERLDVAVSDLRGLPPTEREAEAKRLAAQQAQQPFDLAQPLLLRVRLIVLDQDDQVLALTMHHIISDGWSMGVFFRELGALYRQHTTGVPSKLPALSVQYADYAVWQRQWLSGGRLEQQLTYWTQQLGDLPVLQLPTDRPRPLAVSFRGARVHLKLDEGLSAALRRLAEQTEVTLFMVLLGGFALLMGRYSGQRDIVVGSPIAGRNRTELEGLIGFFVNTLVMRVDLNGSPDVGQFLQRVREMALAAYANQDVPFERIVEALQPVRDLTRNPLCQVMFQLQNMPTEPIQGNGESLRVDKQTASFDIAVDLWLRDNAIVGQVEYSTDLYDEATVVRMVQHYERLLEAMVTHAQCPVTRLPMLTQAETDRLLNEAMGIALPCPPVCLHQLFEQQVARSPDAVAARCGDQQLSYAELNRRATMLAVHLRQRGVQPETVAGVCMERSLDMLVALLAILKAGGAYLPLDPSYPRQRLEFMLSDSGARWVVTESALVNILPSGPELICLDRDGAQIAASPDSDLHTLGPQDPGQLAYLIYTSGTTGQPKGVLVEHRSVVNHAVQIAHSFGLNQNDRVLQFSSLAFDVAVEEIFPTWCAGAAVVLAPSRHLTPSELLTLCAQKHISVLNLPTALWHECVSAIESGRTELPPSVRLIVIGNERVRPDKVAQWQSRFGQRVSLVNAYGTTEAVITSTFFPVPAEWSASTDAVVPVGRPIGNVQAVVLDADLNLVPQGIMGQLFLGGAGVARGYRNLADLTAERFIKCPGIASDKRFYATGDFARTLVDGSIEIHGRLDSQLKIRGHRLEPSEIESVLLGHENVADAAVVMNKSAGGDPRLVAYVVPRSIETGMASAGVPELCDDQVARWMEIYDDIYRQPPPTHDPTFNHVGWNSSYSGLPIPAEEMRSWRDDITRRVLRLHPQRVLEIGCGSGLMMFPIAPACTEYWGLDFSSVALEHLEEALRDSSIGNVRLLLRAADDLSGVPEAAFDVVLLNSVVQYFPSVDYLLRVLDKAMAAVAPGGSIVVGDVRRYDLLDMFDLSVELHRAPADLLLAMLSSRVDRRRFQEQELVLDPQFFLAFQASHPEITRVEIGLKPDSNRNELICYRCDVTLHTDAPNADCEPDWFDWDHEVTSLDEVAFRLAAEPDCLCLSKIPNARTDVDALALKHFVEEHGVNFAGASRTVGEVRRKLRSGTHGGVDPSELARVAQERNYRVKLLWCDKHPTAFNAVLYKTEDMVRCLRLHHARPLKNLPPMRTLANDPILGSWAKANTPRLRELLTARLPPAVVPQDIVYLDMLPRARNGKLDLRALTGTRGGRATGPHAHAPPRDSLEQVLAGLFAQILGLEWVGIFDHFFNELGGHSLLGTRLVGEVGAALDVHVPLRMLFEAPCVAALAESLRNIPGDRDRIDEAARLFIEVANMSDDRVETLLGNMGAT